jgi:sugar-specific transcriptional regulator TrmB
VTITSSTIYLIADNAPINAKVNFATSCVSTASVPTSNVICASNSPVDEVLGLRKITLLIKKMTGSCLNSDTDDHLALFLVKINLKVTSIFPLCIKYFIQCDELGEITISGITEKYSDAQQILAVLASADVFKLFVYGERGFVLTFFLLEKLQMSKKQYYNALHKLKILGLLEKTDGLYHHTVSGSILHKQVVQQLVQLSKHQRDLKIIDVLKKTGQYSDDEIRKFIEQITKDNNNLIPKSTATNNTIINSYEEMVKTIRDRIELANKEILIATRTSFDEGIAALINSIKLGVKVRILVDERLISEYHRVYSSSIQKSESLPVNAKHSEERMKVVENPWYHSGVEIERRVGQIPFGLIIFDRNEVGIELVDSYNPDKFTAGILVKDSQIGDAMLKLYEKLWYNSHSV